ncbi:Nucleoid occlusion protein [uncultured archaeon]|nr:Nucleoid occlusion protein [uncultured archaeon]
MVNKMRKLEDIDLSKVIISDSNVRKLNIEDEIDSLMESLREIGLLHPVEARKIGERYQIIAGQRRTIAAKKLGWPTIPAFITEENEGEDVIRSLIENIERQDIDPQDKANAVIHLKSIYGTWDAVAKKLHKNLITIRNWAGYDAIPEKIKDMVSEKKLPKGAATDLLWSRVSEDEMVNIAEKLSTMIPAIRKDVLAFIKANPEATVDDIDELLTGPSETENEGLSIVLTFSPKVSQAITEECSKRGEEPEVFVNTLVVGHLDKKGLLG